MTDADRGLILVGLIILLAWRREDVTTVLLKECIVDGEVVLVPLEQECPPDQPANPTYPPIDPWENPPII